MMLLKELLIESVEDKGIFKAVMFGGLPGAGKSYIANQLKGVVAPKMVNTDNYVEFLSNKYANEKEEQWKLFGDKSKVMATIQLYNYLNSMLPIMVDGTSNNTSNLLRRRGLLEALGYDVNFVWIDTSLETALNRIKKRTRHVDEDFVKSVYSTAQERKNFIKSKFPGGFLEINNTEGELNDAALAAIYNKTQKFYTSPIKNMIGTDTVKQLRKVGGKYLVPDIYPKNHLQNVLSVWYQR